MEAVGKAYGAPLWQQLYATDDFAVTQAIVRRAEKAGAAAIVLTVDSPNVGIGRPQSWGLAAFGQPGVGRVIDILNTELPAIMRQAGTPAIVDITPAHELRA